MLEVYRNSSVNWKPSPVVALATSVDDSQVAAAREDGSLEIWLVSPGAVGWHCQLTIHGDPESRVSSLIWCRPGSKGLPCGRLFSSSISGSVSHWDLFNLKQTTVLESIGVSIWNMAVAPCSTELNATANGFLSNNNRGDPETSDSDSSDSEDDSDSDDDHAPVVVNPRVAIARDDGCVQIYSINDADEFVYTKSLPRVSGRVLSVTWSPDAQFIYSGSSDGMIRCWDVRRSQEIYRITVGLGGLGSGPELCVWALLSLRCGTLVSADSTGSVQFWDSQHGTLLQAHSYHKGDVNALAAAPSHNRVFSAGSDGQVVLYKLSSETLGSRDVASPDVMKKWVYVGYTRAHTHDVRALAVAVPISREDPLPEALPDQRRKRRKEKPIDFGYLKWAHLGVPMLISAGDDTKLFTYPVKEFTQFSPHDICPAPQRVSVQLAPITEFSQTSLLLVQSSHSLDVLRVSVRGGAFSPSGGVASTNGLFQVKSARKIICSTISNTGVFFAYSDHVKLSLFELKRCVGSDKKQKKCKVGESELTLNKRELPRKLPYAHSMVFSYDSTRLMIAGHDRRIYVVEVASSDLVHAFVPCRDLEDEELPPSEPPITKMFTSSDGQWLAAINCFGDVYVFNLEIMRQHWFISRLDNASVTAGGFSPRNNNVLIVTTSSNQVYALDVEERKLGDWSKQNTFVLPKRFQEFPGEVIGLSFPPSPRTTSVIVYSARAMCLIDFGMPVDRDDESEMIIGQHPALKNLQSNGKPKRMSTDDVQSNGKPKRKRESQIKSKLFGRRNFEFVPFGDPVLFVGHLSESSVLKIYKPWMEVVKNFDSAPVDKHTFGT